MNMAKMSDFELRGLYEKADFAGRDAARKCVPTPMVVGQATSLFGNEIDYSKPVEVVNDGVCGFAWVNLKPGNSQFANWLKKNGYARPDSYYGGVTVWVSDYNQSMQKKKAYADAFARVLSENGFNRCYSMERMD
jgi:hypothetical protein